MPLGSWYSQLPFAGFYDNADRPGSNALGVPDSQQGIALPSRRGLGKWFLVTPPGQSQPFPLQQTDTGPAPYTGRGVDISAAGAHQMGYNPKNFPTDANFKVEPIDTTGLGLAAGYMGGVPGQNDTAVAEGPQQRRKTMPDSLMDMFQPRDAAGEQSNFADALQSRSNSLIGLGLGLLQPSNPLRGQSSWGNALEGFQGGAALDAKTAQAAAMLKQHRDDRAQAQANLQITDAQRAMRDVLGPNASPEQKSEFMKNYYASRTDPGAWILKDIIDPRDPEGERKITVQEHNRTGQIRPPQLPDQGGTAAAAAPVTNWSGANAPVYGKGAGGFSVPPTAGATAAAPRGAVTMPNGEVVTPPPGLNQAGRKAWTNHIATTAAKVASGEMTEAQGNSNLFAGKMEIAKSMLDPETEKKGLDPVWNRVERYGGWVGNTLALPNDYKQYQTAKDAFLNAFLRRVSGATVHDAEYYREEKVYFPQPGDTPERIDYKRQLRDDAIMRMKQQVGPGYKPPPLPSKKQDGEGSGGGSSGTVKWGRDDQGNPVPMP